MTEYKIEKGIQIPARSYSINRGRIHPSHVMDVGDSVFIAGKKEAVTAYFRVVGARHGKRFASRVWTEDGVKGTRIWRVE